MGRLWPVWILVGLLLAGLTGCGSAGSNSREVVARVAGVGSIDKGMLAHWMGVEAAVIHEELPTKPAPKGVLPDPPGFADCVRFLESYAPTSAGLSGADHTVKLTAGELKRQCEHEYQELKQITLNTLITWYWTIGVGLSLGIRFSDAEVRERLATVNKRLFPKPQDFSNYLKWTGQTIGDMLLRSKVQLYEVKMIAAATKAHQQLTKTSSAQQRQAILAAITESISPAQHWVPKTSCAPGYIASACKEYHGPLTPGDPN